MGKEKKEYLGTLLFGAQLVPRTYKTLCLIPSYINLAL